MALHPEFGGADELVAKAPVGVRMIWTAETLQLDAASFHDHAQRVLELAIDGVVVAHKTKRENTSGRGFWDLVEFTKV
ncbi:TPA: hypothetical protein QDB06_001190 [Burkholderia vietnamiensis]|jgi:hypothetical protein|uniref:hypothetical protein n=1 Tax=Burkholderia vietnamiensis TaxID=60552 RepID=UPI001B9B1ED0|nr:hypothetical protein [Burkholderia vietnamiensis]MBR7974515.1 hypothetical protein [Burkholderia vietnamiensis]MCA8183563.1 hypothetical protein [Burkholderia vietnamiensis]HDR9180658.1 hypothetical protein [Burkholderia vietnamiensis]